jgi:hypothetical protein
VRSEMLYRRAAARGDAAFMVDSDDVGTEQFRPCGDAVLDILIPFIARKRFRTKGRLQKIERPQLWLRLLCLLVVAHNRWRPMALMLKKGDALLR